MRIFRFLYFSLFLILIFSCKNRDNGKIHGDWRAYFKDTFIADYNIADDTILIKRHSMNWFEKIPCFYKKQTYFGKIDSSTVLKIISRIDSNKLIVNFGGPYNFRFEKISNNKSVLPLTIKFDLIDIVQKNDSSLLEGLGSGDYQLKLDGTYTFYTNRKVYKGRISDSLKRQLIMYLSSIDTIDTKLTEHCFTIHLMKFNYRLEFTYNGKKVNYYISDQQPIQLTRVTMCLEKIWAEILYKSGYRIL